MIKNDCIPSNPMKPTNPSSPESPFGPAGPRDPLSPRSPRIPAGPSGPKKNTTFINLILERVTKFQPITHGFHNLTAVDKKCD